LAAIAVLAWAASSQAQTRSVSGQVGILGEWDLTATVTPEADGGARAWSGRLSLKHVGFCAADGPEEKTGELRLQVSDPPTETTATLVFQGTACTFRGRFRDSYEGMMSCPGSRDVPMMFSIE